MKVEEAISLTIIMMNSTRRINHTKICNRGWIVVAAATILLTMNFGLFYSFGVFFKPLADDFGWSRSVTSGIQSLFYLSYGVTAISSGILSEKFGSNKVMMTTNFIAGLGLILSSFISELWQIYLTWGVITAVGLSSNFPVAMATVSRSFTSRRGLMLGIVSSGAGMGTLLVVPIIERLIDAFGWSSAYLMLGVITCTVMVAFSSLIRTRDEQIKPEDNGISTNAVKIKFTAQEEAAAGKTAAVIANALHSKAFWLIILTFFTLGFDVQIIMVHIVNLITDTGITPFLATTILSVIGLLSIFGRLSIGAAADRIGTNNALIICCTALPISLLWLLFSNDLWMFYIFAVIFGFAYGGEIPQMPSMINRFFSISAVGSLMGVLAFTNNMGNALGAWTAGAIYDAAQSYQPALIFAAVVSTITLALAMKLKRMKPIP